MRACHRCKFGIPAKDESGIPFVFCGLLPPKDKIIDGRMHWIRPPMALKGWCGQFKLSWLRLFGYGQRA